jgi:hypothetical protein
MHGSITQAIAKILGDVQAFRLTLNAKQCFVG